MKVVVAPNPFKGSLSAPKAAAAIARGVRQVFPEAEIVEVPMADGGEGTVEALVSAHSGTYETVEVEGPHGDPVQAVYGLIEDGATAVVELAASSGLSLLPPDWRDPRKTSTYGFGQLLEAVRARGVNAVIAGLGGSGTNDGAAGMAQALGYRLLDETGRDIPHGGAALAWLDRIDSSKLHPRWREITVTVACDVTNPLLGPLGASIVYGPQKGADTEIAQQLDQALAKLASVIAKDLHVGVAEIPGGGAAGGAGAGLVAFLNAELVPGAPLIVEATRLNEALVGATMVFTGEGRADAQTGYGKAPGEVAKRANALGIPTILLAGSRGDGWQDLLKLGVRRVITIGEEGQNLAQAMGDTESSLTRSAAAACRELV